MTMESSTYPFKFAGESEWGSVLPDAFVGRLSFLFSSAFGSGSACLGGSSKIECTLEMVSTSEQDFVSSIFLNFNASFFVYFSERCFNPSVRNLCASSSSKLPGNRPPFLGKVSNNPTYEKRRRIVEKADILYLKTY